ncbi:MAG: AMP-dependent synthetase [Flavobacteriales bacterium]|nr:AMP-dependent synthetase [Flavobacteriales bacterium]
MNLAALLEKSARRFGNRPALALGPDLFSSYQKTAERVARLAGGLLNTGLRPGDRIAIAMKNCLAYSDVLFAAWHAGATAVPMNAKLHSREFAYMLDHSGARFCFVTEDLEPVIRAAATEAQSRVEIIVINSRGYDGLLSASVVPLAELAPDATAWIFYTSGTTGRPKGAMLTHRNLLMMTVGYFGDVDAIDETESLLHAAPMSHGSGLYILPYVAKGACQIIPESGGFDPREVIELLATHAKVGCFFAPTMVSRLINDPGISGADISNLKTIVYGGGPMYVADCHRALDVLGPKLVQIYGQGEAPMTITGLSRAAHMDTDHPRYLNRLASVGTARTDLEVRVVDGDDRPLPIGEIGEICVRGDVVMRGYWENPQASAESLKGGWLHTGDMGTFDEDGFLTLKDRSKDVIISGGTNIYPREVEEVLLRHEDVAEVSVIGRPDADWGEEVVAFVVAAGDTAPGEAVLDQLCLDHIARFKRPKAYVFVEELPKNNYGKILKTALREMV